MSKKPIQLEDTGERLIPELHHKSLTYGEHLSRYTAGTDLVKGKVVLDIASGAGYGSALLAESAKQVIGVDYDKQAVAYAKSLYKRPNLSYVVGNAEDLPIDTASIDVVVSLETIEHLPHPEVFVQEVLRVLKPGGVFYVSTPNDDEYMEGNEFHLHEFRFKELQTLIDSYFKKASYYYQGTWYATGILHKEGFENETPHITGSKTFGQPTNKAIYYLAVATNGPAVPELKENIIAADSFSELDAYKDHQHREVDIERIKSEINRLDKELSDILNSKGWKMLKKMHTIKHKLKRKG